MIYKYNRFYIVLACLLLAGFTVALFVLFFPLNKDASVSDRYSRATTRNGLIAILLFYAIWFLPEILNRSVELRENCMHCRSFRYPGKIKPFSLEMAYSSVYKLDLKRTFGLFEKLEVYEQSLVHPIVISFAFRRHKELYREICSRVAQANPAVVISPKLLKKLESK